MHHTSGRAVYMPGHSVLLSPEKRLTVNVTFCIPFAAVPKNAHAMLLLRNLSELLKIDHGARAVHSGRLCCVTLCSKHCNSTICLHCAQSSCTARRHGQRGCVQICIFALHTKRDGSEAQQVLNMSVAACIKLGLSHS